MSDFESRLEATLKGVRDEHVQSIASELPATRQRIVHRTRRRRFSFVITTTAVTAAALVAALLIAQAEPLVKDDALPPASTAPVIVQTYELTEPPDDAGFASGAAWVLSSSGDNWSLVAFDPDGGPNSAGVSAVNEGGEARLVATDPYLFVSSSSTHSISRIESGAASSSVSAPSPIELRPDIIGGTEETIWYWSEDNPRGELGAVDVATMEDLGVVYRFGSDAALSHLARFDEDHVFGLARVGDQDWIQPVPRLGANEDFGLMPRFPAADSVNAFVIDRGIGWLAREGTPDGDVVTSVDLTVGEGDQVDLRVADRPTDLAAGDEGVWLLSTTGTGNTLTDLSGGDVGDPIDVGSAGDGQVAVGGGYVWVTNVVDQTLLQIDPDGSPAPGPSPSDGEKEKGASPQPVDERCFDVPFASPTGTVGLGSGGLAGRPLQDSESYNAVLHYDEGSTLSVDVGVGDPPYAPGANRETIEVLGTEAMLADTHEAYMVTFELDSCPYHLLGYAIEREKFKEFATGLLLEGDPAMGNDAWALWPEREPEEAYERCVKSDAGSKRTDETADDRELHAMLEVQTFIHEELGWVDSYPIERARGLEEAYGADYVIFLVTGPADNRLQVVLRESVPGCWSVTRVNPADEEPPEFGGLSMSKQAGELRVGFVLSDQKVLGQLDHMTIETVSGSVIAKARFSVDEFESADGFLTVGYETSGPSYFLILFQDAAGRVLNAKGFALPSGDLVAS